jgi:rhodanese-related sulfurtransferase
MFFKPTTRSIELALLALISFSAVFPIDLLAEHPLADIVKKIPADSVKRIMEAGENLILIDLRPAKDFQQKRLPKATSIPSAEMEKRVREIPKIGRVVLYCACDEYEIIDKAIFLQMLGHRNISVMLEGYPGWVKLGYPLETGRP